MGGGVHWGCRSRGKSPGLKPLLGWRFFRGLKPPANPVEQDYATADPVEQDYATADPVERDYATANPVEQDYAIANLEGQD